MIWLRVERTGEQIQTEGKSEAGSVRKNGKDQCKKVLENTPMINAKNSQEEVNPFLEVLLCKKST